ncbi:MAG: C-GCAxxG-C-C family protein [Verrucomicrobia bacterium]|nr:C-GCAxxG-C-C family protein [Verrucomicrobiota bacterium]
MSKGKEKDTQLSRRKALRAAGITAGAFLLGRFTSRAAAPSPVAGDESSPPEWKPVTLNPQEVAASAYEHYSQGGCMYASFKAICISMARATAHTNPPLSKAIFQFPFWFAQYGRGGLGGQGSLCGVVNGACAALSLFVGEKSTLDAMIAELCGYYERAQLPLFAPQAEESEFDSMPLSL